MDPVALSIAIANNYGVALTVFASVKMRLVRLTCNGRGAHTYLSHTLYTAPRHKTLFRYSLLFKVSLRGPFTRTPRCRRSPCTWLVRARVTKPQIKSHTRAPSPTQPYMNHGLSSDSSKVQSRWQVHLPTWEKCGPSSLFFFFSRYAHERKMVARYPSRENIIRIIPQTRN